MNAEIKIGHRKIGNNNPVFIIAEAGVNHNGDINLAKKLIDEAADSGVDAVKFQNFKAEDLVTPSTLQAEYQKDNAPASSQFEMLKELELSEDEFGELKNYTENKNLVFLSTPFSIKAAEFLNSLHVSAFKIGSGDMNNLPLLEKIVKFDKPILLSTGMADFEMVTESVQVFKKNDFSSFVLLHCTTGYPVKYEDVNLNNMVKLKELYDCPVGFSDHTTGIEASIAAVALGASVVEKHVTLDRNMDGPDHSASIEPTDLGKLVVTIRNVEISLGTFEKTISKKEKQIADVARKSLVANIDIPEGTEILESMIVIKRPGNGLSPKELGKVVGKKTVQKIEKNSLISWNMIK